MSQTPTLKERLESLLSERRLLRELVQKVIIFHLRHDREKAAEFEQSITELVNGPLSLESPELPSAAHLATACQNLPFLFTVKDHPELVDNPRLLFNENISIVPGVMSSNWSPLLQARLIALCGPLDETLSQILSEA